jgi:hypothetical protein
MKTTNSEEAESSRQGQEAGAGQNDPFDLQPAPASYFLLFPA